MGRFKTKEERQSKVMKKKQEKREMRKFMNSHKAENERKELLKRSIVTAKDSNGQ